MEGKGEKSSLRPRRPPRTLLKSSGRTDGRCRSASARHFYLLAAAASVLIRNSARPIQHSSQTPNITLYHKTTKDFSPKELVVPFETDNQACVTITETKVHSIHMISVRCAFAKWMINTL